MARITPQFVVMRVEHWPSFLRLSERVDTLTLAEVCHDVLHVQHSGGKDNIIVVYQN